MREVALGFQGVNNTIRRTGLTPIRSGEDVRHPLSVWTDPSYEGESLMRLRAEYGEYLRGRAEAASPETVSKYQKTLLSFVRSLERNGDPTTLGSLTPRAVNRWVTEQRKEGKKEDGIGSRLSALKVFTKKYLHEHLELTRSDLLRKVPRITPPDKPIPALIESEREQILECFNSSSFEDIRNKALLATYMATGLRFSEVLEMDLTRFDKVSGEMTVRTKGGKIRIVRLSPRALKLVREYLKIRLSEAETGRLWLTAEGTPLTYWGAQSVFRRLKERSGIRKVHAHILRHTFAQHALIKGAERAAVQDMLGHRSDAMSRRYAGSVRQETAARMMPDFSPI
jgi:site-specific recombinase XerD